MRGGRFPLGLAALDFESRTRRASPAAFERQSSIGACAGASKLELAAELPKRRCLASPADVQFLLRGSKTNALVQGVSLKTKNLERIVVIGADICGPASEDQRTTGDLVRLPYLPVRMPA